MVKKNTFFAEHLPVAASRHCVYFLLELKRADVFENEEKEILQRYIEENSNNIVPNQKQVVVSSIASVVKTSTSSCSSGTSRISNKNSSSGSREWTHNEIIELIAIWEEEEFLYDIKHPDYCNKLKGNNDTKQY